MSKQSSYKKEALKASAHLREKLPSRYVVLCCLLFVVSVGVTALFYLVLNHRSFGSWSHSIIAVAIIGVLVLLVAMGALIRLNKTKRIKEPIGLVFSFFALIMGIMFMFVFTPTSVPDETFHFNNSYFYANLIAGKPNLDNELTLRECDLNLIEGRSHQSFSATVSPDNYELQKKKVFEDDTAHRNDVDYHFVNKALTLAGGTLQTRIPASIGINLGRVLSLNAYQLFQLGRFCNLAFFVALLYFAIRLTPVGKALFALIGLLPMTMHLAASYSYDAATIGFGLLLIALLLRLIFGEGKIKTEQFIATEILIALLAPCKTVYCILIALILLIPNSRFKTKRGKGVFFLVSACTAILSIVVMQLPQLLGLISTSAPASPAEYPVATSTPLPSLGRFLSHPFESVFIIFNTLRVWGNFYFETTLGGSLAYFQSNIALPPVALLPYLLLLIVSAQRFCSTAIQISQRKKVTFLIICLLIFLALMVVFYLNASPNPLEQMCIEGIQGRYFLPFLPLFVLIFRVKDYFFRRDFRCLLLPAIFSLNVCYLVFILASCV